jgi:predicted phage replisome organizer
LRRVAMSDVKWIKLTTGMFDDEKIKLIESMPDPDAILIIWVKLLIQAGRTNANGYIFLNENIPYTDEMLATIFSRPLNTVRMALEVFAKFGMIEWDGNGICISNWEKHQNIEGLDRIREQNRLRVAKYREQKALLTDGNVTVTLRNGIDIEVDKNKNKKESSNFVIPPIDEIRDYCNERNNNINAEQFHDFYSAKGWMVGKNKMKDWRAAVRTWERHDKPVSEYRDLTDDPDIRRDAY